MTTNVFYGGKGGVGKTTCAAATGLGLAERGHRTLLVSADPAHSLGDLLDADLGPEPRAIETDLWAVEADPVEGQETYRDIVEAVAAEFQSAGIGLRSEDVERLFDAGFVPGSDEVAALAYLDDWTGEERWDRIVFDTAPTGHTLRLLTLPDVLQQSLSTVGRVQREVGRLVSSARSMVLGPAAFLGGSGDDPVEDVRERMERIAALLRNPDETDFRVVLLPESLAVAETRRFLDRLETFGVPVSTLVVNRVLDAVDSDCDRCRDRAEGHARTLEAVERSFPAVPIRTLPDLGHEASGRADLRALGGRLID